MRDDASGLVRKLWQYCNVLRDDGLSYPDYVEQLTYLLFLKMSDEQTNGPVPKGLGWGSLAGKDAEAMHQQYRRILQRLGGLNGVLGTIFRNSRNKIRDPAKLRLLVTDLIGQTEWSALSVDVKGDAYEGLLEKNARDTKSGAGQYFTPRALIEAIVECVDPLPRQRICDPACGTGGFLVAVHRHWMSRHEELLRRTAKPRIEGVELVEEVARLATMNILLHGMARPHDSRSPIQCMDSLRNPPREQFDVVLTNPPFGVKGSVTYSEKRNHHRMNDQLTISRPDFWVQTANKQLNFVQHVATMLLPGGRGAVVVPDNVLFESGSAATVRRRLLRDYYCHTLLRLPAGLFYAQGVKANVLFFDRPVSRTGKGSPRKVAVYDLRSGNRFSLKTQPLQQSDLREFVEMYRERQTKPYSLGDGRESSPRWRMFETAKILSTTDCSLDLSWRAQSAETAAGSPLIRLEEISKLINEDLQRALSHVAHASSATGAHSDHV